MSLRRFHDPGANRISQVSGCDYAMEAFVKKSGRRADEGAAPDGDIKEHLKDN